MNSIFGHPGDVNNCYRWMSNIGNRKGSDFAFRVGEDLEVGDQQQIYGNLGGVRGERWGFHAEEEQDMNERKVFFSNLESF